MAAAAPVPGVDPKAVWEDPPPDVVDRLLWNAARPVVAAHQPDQESYCVQCRDLWPRTAYRTAQRACAASRAGRHAGYAARVDVRSAGTLFGPRPAYPPSPYARPAAANGYAAALLPLADCLGRAGR
jgi:hypothetical protein